MRKISRTSLLMSQIIFPHLSKMKCLRNLSINAPDFTRDKFFSAHQYHVVSIGDPAWVLD